MVHKTALTTAAIFGAIAVILGAFGAHALKAKLTPELLSTFETGVKYQFYHAFALIAVAILYAYFPNAWMSRAASFFIAGIICFSGSIYALVALKAGGSVGLKGIGIITPIGGLFFIIGWISMIISVYTQKQ